MQRTVALHNLGCKVNAYELDAMGELLEDNGYRIVPFAPGADVYIINTCTVTNIADRKSRQMLHKAKKMNPDAVVVAAGCYVQAKAANLQKDEAIDLVIGNHEKKDLVQILNAYLKNGEKHQVPQIAGVRTYEEIEIHRTAEHTRAYLKIQDGCNQFCSYCIIPYARGRVRSRPAADVCREAERLAAAGYQEIVLTGIHLSSYGTDFGEGSEKLEGGETQFDANIGSGGSGEDVLRHAGCMEAVGNGKEAPLLTLIEKLSDITGIERIRLGSLEPGIITESFARRLSALPKVCPHFHLSLQSGCDSVLARMNRKYRTDAYARGCELLRRYFDNPALTTDIIVGFPGETEEEFQESKAFVGRMNFFETHIFKYSRREGTRAAVMPDQVAEEIKSVRSHEMLALGDKQDTRYRMSWVGKRVPVLFEERVELAGETYWMGHTREYIRVYVKSERELANEILELQLLGEMGDGMEGCV